MPEAAAAPIARVVRDGVVESVHAGHVTVVDSRAKTLVAAGDPEMEMLPRSTAKPLQALACITAGAPLASETLAVACGSHAGEPFHVAAVDRILERAGLDRSWLGNVSAWPRHEQSRDTLACAGAPPHPVYMNCSGKHAAMLLACVVNGWATDSYLDPGHPLQRHVLDTVARSSGQLVNRVVTDGCGAPCPRVSLGSLARSLSGLVGIAESAASAASAGSAASTTPPESPERRVADAMRLHPAYVGGSGHADTRLMQLVPGSIAKSGAEGVLVAALGDGLAVAVKTADGSSRAAMPVAVAALRAAGAKLPALPELELAPVTGGGKQVGRVVVTVGEPATEVELDRRA